MTLTQNLLLLQTLTPAHIILKVTQVTHNFILHISFSRYKMPPQRSELLLMYAVSTVWCTLSFCNK